MVFFVHLIEETSIQLCDTICNGFISYLLSYVAFCDQYLFWFPVQSRFEFHVNFVLKTDRQTINKAISISELLRCPILEHCPKGGKGDSKNHKLFNQNICWTFLNREGRGVASKVQIVQSLIFVSFIGQIIIDVTSIKNSYPQQVKVLLGPKNPKKNSTFSSFHLSYIDSHHTAHPFT